MGCRLNITMRGGKDGWNNGRLLGELVLQAQTRRARQAQVGDQATGFGFGFEGQKVSR